jgi:hypothetical protein
MCIHVYTHVYKRILCAYYMCVYALTNAYAWILWKEYYIIIIREYINSTLANKTAHFVHVCNCKAVAITFQNLNEDSLGASP